MKPILFVLLLFFTALPARAGEAPALEPVKVGKAPPPFALKNEKGEVVTWDSLRGKPTVIYFTHNACWYCTQLIRFLKRMDKKYGPRGLQIIGINVMAKDQRLVIAYKEDLGFIFPMLAGNQEGVLRAYKINYVPVLVFVDARGVVRRIVGHYILEKDLDAAIREILGERGKDQ